MLGRNDKLHRKHLRDASVWHRETQERDWRLRTVTFGRGSGWVYRWTGPGDRVRTCHGTEASVSFLAALREGLASYRLALAGKVDDEAVQRRRDVVLGRAMLDAAQSRTI